MLTFFHIKFFTLDNFLIKFFSSHNLEYKKNFNIQLYFWLYIIPQIFLPVKICTADTWQLTILQKSKMTFSIYLL